MSKIQTTRANGARKRDHALTEAKLALVAAHERGEQGTLSHALRERPAFADALTEFELALLATTGYEAEANAPDVVEVAEVARQRAFAAVFGAQAAVVAQTAQQAQPSAALSLKALRQAQGQKLATLAERLGLGVDVLSALEAGRIRVASVPRRLREALTETLNATADQISAALTLDVAPALRRGQPGAAPREAGHDAAPQQIDFRDAVLVSHSMTQEQQAHWLSESAKR
ncbi:MAG TPA: helix-turn-helix transcriptional regulator [Ktedonobacterales bacterium]|jgi:transcriptional regulator with XRE-family HTH domain